MAKNKRQKRREENKPPRDIFSLVDIERAEALHRIALYDGVSDELLREIECLLKEDSIYTHCCFVIQEHSGKTQSIFSLCFPADPAIGDGSRAGMSYTWLDVKGSWISDNSVCHFGG